MNTDFKKRVKDSFARQTVMETIGASLTFVEPGEVDIELPFRSDLTQQHSFFHAGVVTLIVDTVCGYAALTCMPAVAAVLTVEYKVNFLSSASGEKLIARGRVLKPGRTLTVCFGEVHALQEGKEKLVATMLATMMKCEDTGLTD